MYGNPVLLYSKFTEIGGICANKAVERNNSTGDVQVKVHVNYIKCTGKRTADLQVNIQVNIQVYY